MFFITYLRRELRRRLRQAIFVALGLAIDSLIPPYLPFSQSAVAGRSGKAS